MKRLTLAFIALWVIFLIGCSSTHRIGDTVYEKVVFPSFFGPYQKFIVAYPMGQTNQQKVIQSDSNVGPGSGIVGSTIKAAGFVTGMHQIRNVGRDNNSVTVTGGAVTGGTQDVHVDGNGNHPH